MFILSAHGYVSHFVLSFSFLSLSISLGLFKLIYLYLSNVPSCVLRKYPLNWSSLRFFSAPRCVLHKYCRPDCREVLYRGSSVFFFFSFSQSQGCFSFMKGRFREAVVLVWTIPVITASRMRESVCLLKHTHTHIHITHKCIFTVGGSTAV